MVFGTAAGGGAVVIFRTVGGGGAVVVFGTIAGGGAVLVFGTVAGGGAVARCKHDVYSYSRSKWWAAWVLPYVLRQCLCC